MKEDYNLPNCSECGGPKEITNIDENSNISINEIHEKDCPIVHYWRKVVGSTETN